MSGMGDPDSTQTGLVLVGALPDIDLSSVHVLVCSKGDRALFDGCKDGL